MELNESQLAIVKDAIVVFVVDEGGNITVLSNKKRCQREFPLNREKLKYSKAITFFKTNPQFCWITTDGDEECVTW